MDFDFFVLIVDFDFFVLIVDSDFLVVSLYCFSCFVQFISYPRWITRTHHHDSSIAVTICGSF